MLVDYIATEWDFISCPHIPKCDFMDMLSRDLITKFKTKKMQNVLQGFGWTD
jgi:hypothetical protein